ncbi:preprotein translocase subunit SecE [Persephonella atlantica]|uniref:Protein translocase subunit SecE n=1 Tax=Persephonella atlantica TaxID=2699429 RepID=A0ABS1GHQ4_9AQUI|nr:preprotein translocase subunit SecE [Persephonella atlantica]MBK3332405.1 preprotein translocase subunit SecE [Persephonella atlantica]
MKINEVPNFLKEVQEELKKVSWPSRELVKNATIAVIIFTLLVSVYLWGLDILFDRLFDYLYK